MVERFEFHNHTPRCIRSDVSINECKAQSHCNSHSELSTKQKTSQQIFPTHVPDKFKRFLAPVSVPEARESFGEEEESTGTPVDVTSSGQKLGPEDWEEKRRVVSADCTCKRKWVQNASKYLYVRKIAHHLSKSHRFEGGRKTWRMQWRNLPRWTHFRACCRVLGCWRSQGSDRGGTGEKI